MKMIERLRDQLRQIGATLDDTSNEYALCCDAPSGYVWRANGCASIAIHFATNREAWLSLAIKEDGLPRLRMGLKKVTRQQQIAEMRHLLGDDTWGAAENAPEIINWPANH